MTIRVCHWCGHALSAHKRKLVENYRACERCDCDEYQRGINKEDMVKVIL